MFSYEQTPTPFKYSHHGFFIYKKQIIKNITLQLFLSPVTNKFIEKKTRYEYK